MMKRLIALLLLLGPLPLLGQGTVYFANYVTSAGINAPVFDTDGVTRLEGGTFRAQLYVGSTASALSAAGSPVEFRTGAAAGYVVPSTVTLPGIGPGKTAYIQLRAWDATSSGTYEAAASAGRKHGASATFSVATGGLGSPPSLPANLTGLSSFQLRLAPPPTITGVLIDPNPPVLGQPLRLEVLADGVGPITYQWRRNGSDIPGAQAAVYSQSTALAGAYSVRVIGAGGPASRDVVVIATEFVLHRLATPGGSIVVAPDLPTYPPGNKVSLTAMPEAGFDFLGWGGDLSGTENPTTLFMTSDRSVTANFRSVSGTVYFSNYVPTAGIDAPVFGIDGATLLQGGAFLAQLYAGASPSALGPVGSPAEFRTGAAAGYVVPSTVALPGIAPGLTAHLQLRAWEAAAGTSYEAVAAAGGKHGSSAVFSVITGGAGSPPSLPANLVGLSSFQLRLAAPPTVTAVLIDPNPPVLGEPLRLEVRAEGVSPINYQWRRNGSDIPGANAAVYSQSVAQAGAYSVRVSGPGGGISQDVVSIATEFVLHHLATPGGSILVAPDLPSYLPGSKVSLNAVPEPGFEFTGWGGDLSGTENPATLFMTTDRNITANFRAVSGTVYFSNYVPTAGINAAVLDTDGATPLQGPAFLAQLYAGTSPSGLTPVGSPVEFRTDAAAGYVVPSTVPIPGVAPGDTAHLQLRAWEAAAGSSYEEASGAGAKHGSSEVVSVVTGGAGSPPSLPANLVGLASFSLQLAPPPTITGVRIEPNPPIPGEPLQLEVLVEGTGPFAYQWRRNGSDIPGANLPTYRQTTALAGAYSVRVNGPGGSVSREVVTVATAFVLNRLATPGGSLVVAPDLPSYPPGSQVSLTAVPEAGFEFTGWGGDLSGAENPSTLVMTSDRNVTASFRAVSGTVYLSNYVPTAGIDAPVFDTDGTTPLQGAAFLAQLYAGSSPAVLSPVGSPVEFRTDAAAGYVAPTTVALPLIAPGRIAFLQLRAWEASAGATHEAAVGNHRKHGESETISVVTGGAGSPPSLPANLVGLTSFSLQLETAYELALIVDHGGSITASPELLAYPPGTEITLTAVAEPGYEFSGWTGDLSGSGNPATLVITSDSSVEASFRAVNGTVYFANYVPASGIDAPVFDIGGVTPLEGEAYRAQLFGGPDLDSLSPVGTPVFFRSGAAAGYFVPTTVAIPGVDPGGIALVEVRVWRSGDGDTFEAALAVADGHRAISDRLEISTGGAGTPPSLPAHLVGLRPFALAEGGAPAIREFSGPDRVLFGETAILKVVAAGLEPITFQWFRGETGDTRRPVGDDTAILTTEPLRETAAFWVRVRNSLGLADSPTRVVAVDRRPQEITFLAPTAATYGGPPNPIFAAASSGLPVTVEVLEGPARIAGPSIHFTGAGEVTLRASQPGNEEFLPAPNVDRTLTVGRAPAAILLIRLNQVFDGGPKQPEVKVTPTGLAVRLTFDGSEVPPSAPGDYEVVATVDDLNYAGRAAATFRITSGIHLAGVVFRDLDSDGLRDADESGIGGVTLHLQGLDSTTRLRSALTDPAGKYAFSGIEAGTYFVREENPAGFVSTSPDLRLVTVRPGEVTVVDFGELPAGTIRGVVFEDLNGDGRRDAGEPGLGGVSVRLDGKDGSQTLLTGDLGTYAFEGIGPGSYTVAETDPSGFTSTSPNLRHLSVAPGGAATANFGDQAASTIGGVVFVDANGNRLPDPDEPGLEGVSIRLSGADFSRTLLSDEDGTFRFEGLAPGTYTVEEFDPPGYTSTTPNVRTVSLTRGGAARALFGDQAAATVTGVVFEDKNGNGSADPGEPGINGITLRLIGTELDLRTTTDSGGNFVFPDLAPGTFVLEETDPAGFISTTPNRRSVTLPIGGSVNVHFGDQPAGTVSGFVFEDRDGNALRDAGELGLGGVTLRLSGATGQRTTTTAGDGSYLFTGVDPGAYSLLELDPVGYVSTTPNLRSLSVASGGAASAEFGDQAVGTVAGAVFEDLDGNGRRESGEPGLGGVTIRLSGPAGLQSTPTAGDGSFQFADVIPGTYLVEEIDPLGFSSTTPNLRRLTVPSGGAATASFGDQAAGTVSGVVFEDLNGNGRQESGEPGLGGVAIRLIGGAGQRDTTSAGDGSFRFAQVDPGRYAVEETDPPGYSSTTPNVRLTVVTSGGAATAAFGDQASGTVAGVVFADANGNGLRESSEAGLGGVALRLTGADGTRTTTTSGDGTYQFTGLTPGSYTVEETDPPGFVSTTPNLRAVSLASGGAASAIFGDQPVQTISGIVFEDRNGNGRFDIGEPGISGVVLLLLRADDGTLERDTLTAGDGTFVFAEVPAGDYHVRQAIPSDYTVGSSPEAPPLPGLHGAVEPSEFAQKSVSLASGGAASVNFPNNVTGQLSGSVFNDLDGDGTQAPGELGLGGATIEVRHADTAAVLATAVSSGDGTFVVADLAAGTYEIVQHPLPGYQPAEAVVSVALDEGSAAIANFPNRATGTLSGRVFNDEDGDGLRGAAEPGIGGVRLRLHGPSTRETTTAGDGTFLFTEVEPGTWSVTEEVPEGFVATTAETLSLALSAGTASNATFGNQSAAVRPPEIVTEPSDFLLTEGDSAALTVVVDGTEPMDLQWLKEGTPIPGATEATLSFAAVVLADSGRYQLRARNAVGTATSRVVQVTVASADPFTSWTRSAALPADLRGPNDDPDHDGLPNLVEFVLGTSPLVVSTAGLPSLVVVARDADRLLGLQLARTHASFGYRLFLEASTDLVRWAEIPTETELVQSGTTADLVRLLDATPIATEPHRFLRLGVSPQNPPSAPARLVILSGPPLAAAFRLALEGEAGQTYAIEWSADLRSWHRLQEVVAGSTPEIVVDDPQITSPQRFYRAIAR